MNNISKFNGQYLKCIVSNYTSSKNYLGNSGSLIVIQPKSGRLNDIEWETKHKNGDISRNYVYLGNEFLASGFGFGSQYILEKAEAIINSYDDDITTLGRKDKELDEKIDREIDELKEEFNKYVKTHGGHIEDTVVNINGSNILTKDIILHGEEAQYKNLEVKEIKISINGNICKDSFAYVPIGSYIKTIEMEVEIFKNDSGGIDSLQVLHSFNNDEYEYEGVKVNYNLDTDICIDSDYDIYRLHYYNMLDEEVIVDSPMKNVIKTVYVNVKATPPAQYKYYPGIYRKYNIKITSAGNSIVENTIDVKANVNIRPQYYAKYSDTGILNKESFNSYKALNSFEDYDTTIVKFDINRNMNSNKHIYLAVPSNFTVNKIYIIKNNNERFNWTGAVNIMKNRNMTCVGTDENNPYYISYDIYELYASKGFFENNTISLYQVEFNISYNYIKDNTGFYDRDYNNIPTRNVTYESTELRSSEVFTINDEEFNDIYWINYTNGINSDVDLLRQKLVEVSSNGAIK